MGLFGRELRLVAWILMLASARRRKPVVVNVTALLVVGWTSY